MKAWKDVHWKSIAVWGLAWLNTIVFETVIQLRSMLYEVVWWEASHSLKLKLKGEVIVQPIQHKCSV